MEKRNKIIYWIATVWLSLGMLSTAIVQLLKYKEGQGGLDSIIHLGYPVYILTLLGICKVMGVIVVLIPKFPLVKEWAYAGFAFTVVGAMYSHLAVGDAFTATLPALLLLVLTALSWYFRPADRKINFVN